VTVQNDRGIFCLSLDFELVWGSRDLTTDLHGLVQLAERTRREVFPGLLDRLAAHGIIATWATVGHLFLGAAARGTGQLHPDLQPPRHAWLRGAWWEGVPAGTEAEHPAFYGESLVRRLVAAGQEVGSHSFSHPIFGDPGCSRATADSELQRCVEEARRLGLTLRSFVFPRNELGHIDLLRRHGFTCYRGPEPVWYRRPWVPGPAGRLLHLAYVAAARRPPTVVPRRDAHGLWDIPASATFLPIDGVRRYIPIAQRVRRSVAGLEAAAADRRICHLYLHPINLATDPPALLEAFDQIFAAAARLRDAGRLDILPMSEIAAQAEARWAARAGASAVEASRAGA
jgi:peptidoglycan/xylan/chitin deacetylase (PgdA/CDA1 family)